MSDHATDHHGDDESGLPHVTPLKVYFGVWAALTMLTVITVAVSYVDFGGFNIVMALFVAFIKATLVAAFFMHLKYDSKLNTVVFGSSLIFLSIFFFLTFADMSTRGKVDAHQGTFVNAHGVKDLKAVVPAAAAGHEAHH